MPRTLSKKIPAQITLGIFHNTFTEGLQMSREEIAFTALHCTAENSLPLPILSVTSAQFRYLHIPSLGVHSPCFYPMTFSSLEKTSFFEQVLYRTYLIYLYFSGKSRVLQSIVFLATTDLKLRITITSFNRLGWLRK